MGKVKSYTRKTKSGKTVKVKEHIRIGMKGSQGTYLGKGVYSNSSGKFKKRGIANRLAREMSDESVRAMLIDEALYDKGISWMEYVLNDDEFKRETRMLLGRKLANMPRGDADKYGI